MVSRLSPESGAESAAARTSVQHGLAGSQGPRSSRRQAGQGISDTRFASSNKLLSVPPMSSRKDLMAELAALEQRACERQASNLVGKKYWRTLEELANSDAFEELVRQEYPEQTAQWDDSISRRHFLTLMGASLALAGLGCSVRPAPTRVVVPRVEAPENLV